MVYWRVIGASSLLMALGFGIPIIGIIGLWLFVTGAREYSRELLLPAALYSIAYLSPTIYTHDVTLTFVLSTVVLLALILAALKFNAVVKSMAVAKVNKFMEWGAKLVVVGAFTYAVYVGAFIMALGFLFIAYGALTR